jgi:transposase InsO family protein
MENFFSTLKTELVYRQSWRTREEAENALFAYIDGWYNTERIQARLAWLSPDEYEAIWRDRPAVEHDQHASAADGADPAPVS